MKNRIIYIWLTVLTILVMVVLLTNIYIMPNKEVEILGIRGSLDDLWDEVGHIRVKTNKLHMMMNKTDFEDFFDRCWNRYEYIC